MNLEILQSAVNVFKKEIEDAIKTATFGGRQYTDGHQAKEGLIRSQRLIMGIHEVVKKGLHDELKIRKREHLIYPRIGFSAPELAITGFIKAKNQDVVVLFDNDTPTREEVRGGPLLGEFDAVGKSQSERSIVVGVRSQMSSVDKNFDTLMERTFAETLNLRLRLPQLIMGEVYLLPVMEYDETAMKRNTIGFKHRPVKIEKFIRTFLSISNRAPEEHGLEGIYKYERSALILVDFRLTPPKVFLTLEELKAAGHIGSSFERDYDKLSPKDFAKDVVRIHEQRHPKKVEARSTTNILNIFQT